MSTIWTDEMDRAIYAGFTGGKSAREIGEELGKTRNAVLGRVFRLEINIERPRREPRPKKPVLPRKIYTILPFTDEQIAERIADARDLGVTWGSLAAEFGVDMGTARNWAKKLGVFKESLSVKRFTAEEFQYICTAWDRYDPVEDIAADLNRSFGVIRQAILRLQREGKIASRDHAKTRLLKRYGAASLAAGSTPSEALKQMSQAKQIAFSAAIVAAKAAKAKFQEHAVSRMREQIAAGEDRNACIFAARAQGVTLERISEEFSVTRERIRQICNQYAEKLVLIHLQNSVAADGAAA